jgi:hypothetical protein
MLPSPPCAVLLLRTASSTLGNGCLLVGTRILTRAGLPTPAAGQDHHAAEQNTLSSPSQLCTRFVALHELSLTSSEGANFTPWSINMRA